MSKKLEFIISAKDQASPEVRKATDSLKRLDDQAKDTDNSTQGLWKQMAGGALVAQGIGAAVNIAVGALKGFVVGSIELYNVQAKVEGQLNAVLKSTGNAAGMTADQIKKMASAYQAQTTFGDEAIIGAQNLLLTFTKIGGETFPRATKAILDVSQAMGQDLKSSTTQIGKALNDPIEGLGALTRVGIQFTDVQKDMIKSMAEAGDMAGAQGIILSELERQFGGSAEAFAKTFEGRGMQLKNTWGDVMEEVGKGFAEKFQPLLEDAAEWLDKNKDAIVEFGKTAAQVLGEVGALFSGLVTILGGVASAIGWVADKLAFLNPGSIMIELAEAQEAHAAAIGFVKDQMQGVADALDRVRKEQIDAQKKIETEFWASIKTMGERLKKERESERIERAKVVEAATKKELSAIDSLLAKYNQVPKTLYDQLKEHQAITREMGLQHKQLNDTIKAMEAFADGVRNMPGRKNPFEDFSGVEVPGMFEVEPVSDYADAVEDAGKGWEKISKAIDHSRDLLYGMEDFLDGWGLDVAANFVGKVNKFMGDAQGAAASFATGNIIGGIAGSLSALGSLGEIIGGIFNKDGTDDMIKRFKSVGVSISDNIIDKIKEMEDAGVDAGVALARVTDEIIAAGELTEQNMHGYKVMIQDIFMQLDNHRLSTIEATKEVGEAFLALANKAKEAGLEGSKALADIMNDARNRGIVSKDMMEWIDSERQRGIDSLTAHIEGVSNTQDGYNRALRDTMAMYQGMVADGKSYTEIVGAMGGALDALLAIETKKGFTGGDGYLAELLGMRDFVKKNATVLDAMQATQTVMESMANTGILTADRFADAQASMLDYYNNLILNGAGEEKSLQSIFPMLAKQVWYAKQYGYELDDATKKLVEQAEQQGLNLEDAIPAEERMLDLQERMVTALEKMAGIFHDDLPAGIGKTEDAFKRAADAALKIKIPNGDNLGDGGGGEIPGYAGGTDWRYLGRAQWVGENGRELLQVRSDGKAKIIPNNKLSDGGVGGAKQISITLNLPNVTNQDVVGELSRALTTNKGLIKTQIIQMVH